MRGSDDPALHAVATDSRDRTFTVAYNEGWVVRDTSDPGASGPKVVDMLPADTQITAIVTVRLASGIMRVRFENDEVACWVSDKSGDGTSLLEEPAATGMVVSPAISKPVRPRRQTVPAAIAVAPAKKKE